MIFQLVQLVGNPPENLLETLRQELNQESLVQAIETPTLEEAANSIPVLLPDLIVFFVDSVDAPEDKVGYVRDFCQAIRAQMAEHRSIIVVSAEAADKEERINYFLSGADDFLDTNTESEEFAVRLLVHLRRNVEMLSNKQTRLPNLTMFSRIIQRHINLQTPWSLLLIEMNHFEDYAEVYGKIPCEQIMKTLAALLKSLIIAPDIVGQTDSNQLLVLSTPDKSDKLAASLCQKFDEVVSSFYSKRDQKRGYIVSVVNEQISRRVPFVSLSVGLASSTHQQHQSYTSAFNVALDMKTLAQANFGSCWMAESHKLTGGAAPVNQDARIKTILLVESDAAMAFLLKTTLEMQHYHVEIAHSEDEAKEYLEVHEHCDLVILDSLLHGEESGLRLCNWIRQHPCHQSMHIICASTLHEREKALNAGADIYLPKPFELSSLFHLVDYFLAV